MLYYETYGAGEPVVFIHGVGVTSRVWEFQREELSKHFRMIVYDLRGSGKSQKTPGMFHTCELMAEDLKGLLDHLQLKRVNIVGISLGACIAMKLAIEYPETVGRLVLTGAFADFRGVLSFVTRHLAHIIGRMLMTRTFGELATKIMLPSSTGEKLLYYHRNIISIDRDEVVKYSQILRSYKITSALGKIKSPAIILYGQYEWGLHKYGRLIRERVKDSRMVVIPGVGHGWNGENPGLFNRTVLDFLLSQT